MTSLNRRKLLQGLTASAAAIALPLPSFAKAVVATNKAAVPFHYGWACIFARHNNGVSTADIARVFHLPKREAQALMDRMVLRGVVTPPDVLGRAQPTRTWQPWEGTAHNVQGKNTNTSQHAKHQPKPKRVSDAFRRMIAHVSEDPSFGWNGSAAS